MVVEKISALQETCWRNPKEQPMALAQYSLTKEDVLDAQARWQRFAAYFKTAFPETGSL